ncbi:prolyl oligopeptidase family serine peptidase [Granulicella sp. 5B5]|uniref:S9 family peptidase n=1 Tax=Granulicella sp. 5B5 TaxID=1617967 RepID=UPI0015F3F704|nr:prolyl oligopeptidase family serine peptidase [Granulicella sp. 5B5]QMV19392.1 prolyl oligopeptidase family serine peptidase [Granulicella sp. 5B5]
MRTFLCAVVVAVPLIVQAQTKPAITLDEFFNATDVSSARISPDGAAVVVGVNAPDWKGNQFTDDLWVWTRQSGKLVPLTHGGRDTAPAWSPDGRAVAFLSDRTLPGDDDKNPTTRVWVVSASGGEAMPAYREALDAHSFAWCADGTKLIAAVTEPLSKEAQDAHDEEWKDVIRWREQERGDVLLALPVTRVLSPSTVPAMMHPEDKAAHDKPEYPAGSTVLARSAFTVNEVVPSPSGKWIAFETGPVSQRLEDPADTEMYLVAAEGGKPKRLTKNEALESQLQWTPDGTHIDFLVQAAGGAVEGPYRDVQGRLYSLDVATEKVTRLGGEFAGSWSDPAVTEDGTVLATGSTGIEQAIYRVEGSSATKVVTEPGHYSKPDAALHAKAVLFVHSRINVPAQVFVADDVAGLGGAKAVTAFNPVFAERVQVPWKPYKWKSTDGTEVEGVLLYPPGKMGAKHLRMLTLIHGGPADADGDHFGADWYDWATYAASHGWLVFRPNYRGSSGYGDAFMLGIEPHIVSAPGRDILSGVDALVKDGIADPDRLAIGGYSYGGYMTNWLITQTTRFKAAVTGAGAVEHAANWGNDDLTYDDAWYLSGTPWEKPELYESEAALFQLNKVKTPTHIVGGDADDRVSYFEDVLLERGLQRLGVPHELLVFPGENHPLDKNPWHGYIKVREEMKWLDKYDPKE